MIPARGRFLLPLLPTSAKSTGLGEEMTSEFLHPPEIARGLLQVPAQFAVSRRIGARTDGNADGSEAMELPHHGMNFGADVQESPRAGVIKNFDIGARAAGSETWLPSMAAFAGLALDWLFHGGHSLGSLP